MSLFTRYGSTPFQCETSVGGDGGRRRDENVLCFAGIWYAHFAVTPMNWRHSVVEGKKSHLILRAYDSDQTPAVCTITQRKIRDAFKMGCFVLTIMHCEYELCWTLNVSVDHQFDFREVIKGHSVFWISLLCSCRDEWGKWIAKHRRLSLFFTTCQNNFAF